MTQPHVRTTIAVSFSYVERQTVLSFLATNMLQFLPPDLPDKYRTSLIDFPDIEEEISIYHASNHIRDGLMRLFLHVSHGERRVHSAISLYRIVNGSLDSDSLVDIWDNSIQY